MTRNCKPSGGKASTTTANKCSQSSAWKSAELIQAISKKLREPTSPNDHLAEEMADVIICLHQLKMMYGIPDDAISDRMEAKTIRLAKRMEES